MAPSSDKVAVGWRSAICNCVAFWPELSAPRFYRACQIEHESWLLIVGSQEIRKKRLEMEKLVRRGLPESFHRILKRFGDSGDAASFHRPPEVDFEPEALDAEMAFFLSESLGTQVQSCSDPVRLADYLANKASRGLTEQMWLEDWTKGDMGLWPAELVAEEALTIEEANDLFKIHLDADFVKQLAAALGA